ncbi:hypothetical protein [Blautia sp. LMAG:75]|nr:hypothetical protein [Blautia sp. LMAG:75]
MSDLKVLIIVGDKKMTAYLEEREVEMIEHEVEYMRNYQRNEGLEEDWDIASEISAIIHEHLREKRLKNQKIMGEKYAGEIDRGRED